MSETKETQLKVEESTIKTLGFWVEIGNLICEVKAEVSEKNRWIVDVQLLSYNKEVQLDPGDLYALLAALERLKKQGYPLPPLNEVKR